MTSLRHLTLVSGYQVSAVAVMTLVAFLFWPSSALAVLAGGGIMVANFWALRVLGARAILGQKPKLAAGLALVLKLVIVGGLMAVALLVLRLDLLGFAVGMSSLFVGVFLAMVHQAFLPAPSDRPSRSAA